MILINSEWECRLVHFTLEGEKNGLFYKVENIPALELSNSTSEYIP